MLGQLGITPNSYWDQKRLTPTLYYAISLQKQDHYLSVNLIHAVIHQLHGVGVREQLVTYNVIISMKIENKKYW